MRRSLNCVLAALSPLAMLCAMTSTALATTAPVLDVYGPTLTVDPTSTSSHQPAWARWEQRGVDIDGTLRMPVPLGWSVAGDPLGGGYAAGRTLGDVNLCTGSYHPTEIDLAFPTLGLPVVIGRTYNGVQEDGAGGYASFEGYQGFNWTQVAQPQISFVPGATDDLDVIYLIYGNDRFVEFKRIGSGATEFKGKNGAAGVIQYTAGGGGVPELYTYYDQRGDQIVFFGFDGPSAHGAGHLWKMVDPAGNTAYVENSSTAATAASNGYDISDRMKNIYDASGRKYLFTYNSFGTAFRLQKVEAQILVSGSYTTIAQVEYDYYTSTDTGKGREGDLRLVTITMKGVSGGDYVRRKYYRYYTNTTWADSDGSRGKLHLLKMVVGFDGTRQYDYAGDSTFDQDYYSETDANLLPYAEAYFEYTSNTDWRLKDAIFNGNCGCSGGTSGTYTFTYGQSSGYATAVANTSYDTGWAERTIIVQPDGTYVTQHFDETGAVLGRVVSAASPANWTAGAGSNKTWITDVERNGSGQVTAIHSPANVTGYTHSTGAITYSSSVGLVTTYARHSASDNLDGLRDSVSLKEGTSGSAGLVSSVTMADVQLVVGTVGVSMPAVTHMKTYPAGGSTGLDTAIATTYWSGTNTNVQFLVPKVITTTNPLVLDGSGGSAQHNGSGSTTATYRYFRTDGSTAYTKDAGGIISYMGRNALGQTITQIQDVNTASGDILTSSTPDNDTASTWSLSTSGTAIHAKTTYTYDDQGRVLTRTQPSAETPGSSTRTTTYKYALDTAELGTFVSPLYAGGSYYGPLSYTRVNHAGKPDRRATIEIGSPSGSIPTSTSPTTSAGTAWSGLVDTVYDQSGMRATETRTYLTTSTYDSSFVGYDAMGRIARTIDATGTMQRSVFDERGKVIERWMGTNDHGLTNPTGSVSGSNDLVKIEALEYDGNPAMGGGNGYMTKRSQDSAGTWSGGVGDRVTTYSYDYRGRAIVTLPPVAPYSVTAYDNSNRATATAQYSSTSGLTISTDPTTSSASTRVALSETAYDERGQVYQTTRWEIVQSGGSAGNKGSSQVTDNWYDADGRLVKTIGNQITKSAYDRLGRTTDRFVIAKVDDTTYAHAQDVSGDLVLEQTHIGLDPKTGKTLAQWLVQRAHDDPASGGSTGALDTNADGDPQTLTPANIQANARPQITATVYDAWDRVSATVPYGTYGGTTFTYSASAPDTGANNPTTTYVYDTFGRLKDVQVPGAAATTYNTNRTSYDFTGRKSKTVDNYVDGTPGGGTYNDQDRVTEFAYTNGLMTSVARRMPSGSDDQVTTYEYDTTSGVSAASIIKAKNILTRVVYPPQYTSGGVDQVDTDRDVIYVYNALSQVSTTTDPEGNVITTTYDAGGRVTAREATTIIGTFDSSITRIETTYEPRGMAAGVTQKDGGGTVKDEVAFAYDGWGNMTTFTQDPDSAISGGSGRGSYAMTWTYALNSTSGCNRALYLDSWTQPDGTGGGTSFTVTYLSGLDADVCRASATKDASAVELGEYAYLGANTVVGMDYNQPHGGTGTWLYGGGGSSTYNTYMDRFNRPTSVQWSPGIGATPAFVDLSQDYNVRGDNVARVDSVLKDAAVSPKNTFGYLTTLDDLRRIHEREEGELNGGHTSVTTRARIETYARNLAGRLTTDEVSLDGNLTYTDGPLKEYEAGEMNDTRTYNRRNELTNRSYNSYDYSGSPNSFALTYDKNGNLTDDGEKYKYKYNPWGQLVQIKDTGSPNNVQANFRYNGLGQRIAEQLDTDRSTNTGVADGVVNSYDLWFFIAVDPQGRRVATFRNTDAYPKETFAYHASGARGPSFAGGVQLRDRNSSLSDPSKWATETAGSTRSERMYYCTDPQGSVVALVKSDGKLMEQYRYSPTGVPFGIPQGNVKSDGVVNAATSGTTDYTIVNAMIGGTYQARGDFNLDGVITSADTAIVTAASGKTLGRGRLTEAEVGSRHCGTDVETLGSNFQTLTTRPHQPIRDSHIGIALQNVSTSNMSQVLRSTSDCTSCGAREDFAQTFDVAVIGGGSSDCNSLFRVYLATKEQADAWANYCDELNGTGDAWAMMLCNMQLMFYMAAQAMAWNAYITCGSTPGNGLYPSCDIQLPDVRLPKYYTPLDGNQMPPLEWSPCGCQEQWNKNYAWCTGGGLTLLPKGCDYTEAEPACWRKAFDQLNKCIASCLTSPPPPPPSSKGKSARK
jgi:YD repeat-containing protein